MKRNLYIIIFFLAVAISFAQKPASPAGRQGQARIDSLLKELPKQKNDIRKVNLLNSLSYNYQYVYAKKGIEYGKQALKLARKLKWEKGIATAQYNIAADYIVQGKGDTALIYANAAYATGKKLNDNSVIANSLMNIGNSCTLLSRYTEALVYHRQALLYAEKTGNELLKAQIQLWMGDAYTNMVEFDKAQDCFETSLNTAEHLGDKQIYILLLQYSALAFYYNVQDSIAKTRYINALKLSKQYGFRESEAIIYQSIGNIYNALSDYQAANDYYLQALKLSEELYNSNSMAFAWMSLGANYVQITDYSRALKYTERAQEFFEQTGNKFLISYCMSLKADCYKHSSDYEKSLTYYKGYLNLSYETNHKDHAALACSNIAQVYYSLSDYSQSLSYARQALDISNEIKSHECLSSVFSLYVKLCLNAPDPILTKMKVKPAEKYDHALIYADSALYYANETGNIDDMVPAWKLLSEIRRKQGNFEKALDAFETYISLRDSITGEETQKQVTRKQIQFEYDKKEAAVKAEQEKKDILVKEQMKSQRAVRNFSFAGLAGLLVFSFLMVRQRNKVKREKSKSEALLLNVLPEEVADELKAKGSAEAKQFDEVSILFTDFVHFTQTAEKLTPQQLVQELNECFTAFDNIIERNGLEKIKTIGDAYMAVCGLPTSDPKHAQKTVQAALEIRDFIEERRKSEKVFEIRIGIHSGSVVAGIVGVKKFAYDIWGDTVNTAARMEQSGEPGKVNISETTYELVKNDFNCTYRGKVEAKGKGEVDMYFVS